MRNMKILIEVTNVAACAVNKKIHETCFMEKQFFMENRKRGTNNSAEGAFYNKNVRQIKLFMKQS